MLAAFSGVGRNIECNLAKIHHPCRVLAYNRSYLQIHDPYLFALNPIQMNLTGKCCYMPYPFAPKSQIEIDALSKLNDYFQNVDYDSFY